MSSNKHSPSPIANQKQPIYEDEIGLADIYVMIKRNSKLFFSVIIISFLISLTVTYSKVQTEAQVQTAVPKANYKDKVKYKVKYKILIPISGIVFGVALALFSVFINEFKFFSEFIKRVKEAEKANLK